MTRLRKPAAPTFPSSIAATHEPRQAGTRRENQGPSTAIDQILTTRKVVEIVGRHRCTLYRWMAAGQFPKKRSFRGRTVGWLRSEVEKWLAGDEVASH
jgi:prophage regulatory protein